MASNIVVDNIQLHVVPAKEKDVIKFLSIRCVEPQLLQPDESPVMYLGLPMPRKSRRASRQRRYRTTRG